MNGGWYFENQNNALETPVREKIRNWMSTV